MSLFSTKKSLKILCCILVFLIAILCVIFIDSSKERNKTDFVEFIDVGQGDCALIVSGDTVALIDAGTPMSSTAISKTLRRHNIDTIDALILTHPHDDHIGSAQFILEEFYVNNLILPAIIPADDQDAEALKSIRDIADYTKTARHTAKEGMVINIGNFKLTVLLCEKSVEDENDSSIVIMVQNGNSRFLFTGDAEEFCENKLLEQNVDLSCDVLKVAHHGSNSSTTTEFLQAVSPTYSVISVGKENAYKHPSDKVLKRLQICGTQVLRTDKVGNIRFIVKNNTIVLEK